jgi:hypothetical protein
VAPESVDLDITLFKDTATILVPSAEEVTHRQPEVGLALADQVFPEFVDM